jgi:hypothetical protein
MATGILFKIIIIIIIENGEVIVGKAMKNENDSEMSQSDDIFTKRISKLTS